jgi:hypothetical protein
MADVRLHHFVHTGTGAHPACYPMRTGGSFPESKEAGAWSCPLWWAFPSIPPYVLMV